MKWNSHIILVLYDILWLCTLPLILLYAFSRKDLRFRLWECLGSPRPSACHIAKTTQRTIILVHAVSVGEVLSVSPIVRILREKMDASVILSTTIADAETISSRVPDTFDAMTFAPWDLSLFVQSWFSKLNPALILISETDLWPNYLTCAHRRNIPVFLTNGRISSSLGRGLALLQGFSRDTLRGISHFFVQTEQDANRLSNADIEEYRITVCGNTKYEAAIALEPPPSHQKERLAVLRELNRPILVAGSTHDPEESIILTSVNQLPNEKRPVAIIAPRVIDRSSAIMALVHSFGLSAQLWSKLDSSDATESINVVIIDQLGALVHLYGIATFAFVGGTFAPVGGHNFLEAAAQECPVIGGPYTYNFSRDVALFSQGDGITIVDSAEDFPRVLFSMLENPKETRELGVRGASIIQAQQGSAEHTARSIVERTFEHSEEQST